MKLCVAKTSVEGPSANAPFDNSSASQRFAVLNGHGLAILLRSLSSFGVVFGDFPVLWRSFTFPVWFARCFNRTMTEWLTLNRSAVFM